MTDINKYYSEVAKAILAHFKPNEITALKLGEKAILDMIGYDQNDEHERVLNYPEHFEISIADAYENGLTIEQCLEKFLDGCKTLVYGHLSVL